MQTGGAERVATLLCNEWAERGYEVFIMPTFSGGGDCVYSLDERVKIEYLSDRVGHSAMRPMQLIRRFLCLRDTIRNFAPQVVISFFTDLNVVTLLATVGLGVPVIVSERTYPPAHNVGRFWSLSRRLTYWRAKRVVVQTERAKVWVDEKCPGANTSVVPNPVVWPLPAGEPTVCPSRYVADGRQFVLGVGRLSWEKGFDRLIAAFAAIANEVPFWDLVIVGEGNERKALESQRDALGHHNRIHLPGRVGNIGSWYEQADLYVLSSHFEGFPNTLLEAMAYGLPTISIDCPTGPRDIIRHGIDGLLVDKGVETNKLAKILAGVIHDEAKRRAIANRALEVRERFSLERIGTLWEEVLGLQV